MTTSSLHPIYLNEPYKSSNDSRQYCSFTLPNKLQCLLIQDKDTDNSAASLTVHVGQIQDPIERPGLAHFLEHMLFMGTKKYPNQNDYAQYIANNSGMTNAYTAYLDTNYYFNCSNSGFEGALDRFSQFFVAPLMDETCVDKEINAVHSEHTKNLMQDNWREYQLFRSTSDPNHPFNKFGTGSLETLQHKGIRDDLLKFYEQYYSANIMKLVVYSDKDIEQLKEWVTSMFSDVKNKNLPTRYEFSEGIPFKQEQMGQFFQINPIQDKNTLEFLWVIENMNPHYRTKPAAYLKRLFNNKGKNSLCSFLVDEGLALSVDSSYFVHMDLFTEFTVQVSLTQKGLQMREKVCEVVFQYLQNIKNHGISSQFYKEISNILDISFKYQDKIEAMSYVNDLSMKMQYFPIEDVVRQSYVMDKYNHELIKQTLNSLKIDNLRIYLTSKSTQKQCNLKEQWYGTEYACQKFDKELINLFNNPKITKSKNGKVLSMPPTNPFIPTNFSLKDSNRLSKIPQLVSQSPQLDVWHKADNQFFKPKSQIRYKIYSNDSNFGKDVKSYICLDFWLGLLQEDLAELLYQGTQASIAMNFAIDIQGFVIEGAGYSDTLNRFMESVFKRISEFKPSQLAHKIKFEDFRIETIKGNLNFKMKTPYQQALFLSSKLLTRSSNIAFPEVQLQILKDLKFEDILNFHAHWLKTFYVETLFLGNLNSQSAISSAEHAVKSISGLQKFQSQPLPQLQIPEVRILNLPNNSQWFYEGKLFEDENGNNNTSSQHQEKNSCIMSYFQYKEETPRLILLFKLLITYLREPCFNTLRTNEQLGYIVSSATTSIRGILHYMFLVQSNVRSPQFVSSRISEFLNKMRGEIKEIDMSQFKLICQSVSAELNKKDISLDDEGMRFWKQVNNRTYQFDLKEIILRELKTVTLDEFKNIFEELFFKNRKVIETHLISKGHFEENEKVKGVRMKIFKNVKQIDSVDQFKKNTQLFEVQKPSL